jgi:hypothetical protein
LILFFQQFLLPGRLRDRQSNDPGIIADFMMGEQAAFMPLRCHGIHQVPHHARGCILRVMKIEMRYVHCLLSPFLENRCQKPPAAQ